MVLEKLKHSLFSQRWRILFLRIDTGINENGQGEFGQILLIFGTK